MIDAHLIDTRLDESVQKGDKKCPEEWHARDRAREGALDGVDSCTHEGRNYTIGRACYRKGFKGRVESLYSERCECTSL